MQAIRTIGLTLLATVLAQPSLAVGQVLSLRVGATTGNVFIENGTGSAVSIDAYEIASASGALRPSEWLSIADNYDLSGDDSVDQMSDWFVISSDGASLAEGSLDAFSGQLAIGQRVDLGPIWQTTAAADLSFEYLIGDTLFAAQPAYFLEADLNRDDVVSVSDYALLRDSIGASGTAADINNDGVVNTADVEGFLEQFGETNPIALPGLAAAVFSPVVVPEPTPAVLALASVAALAWRGRRRVG